eukprot:4969819-Alexandrium_andersonii.AAC.1
MAFGASRAGGAFWGGSGGAVAPPPGGRAANRCKLLQAVCSAWYTLVGIRSALAERGARVREGLGAGGLGASGLLL